VRRWLIALSLAGCAAQPPAPVTSPTTAATASATPSVASGWIDTSTDKIPPPEMGKGLTLVPDHKGRPNKALHFDGQGSFFKVNMDINPSLLPEFTFHAWVRFTGDPAAKATMQVFSHDDGEYDRSAGLDGRGAGGYGWSCFAGDKQVLGTLPLKAKEWVMFTAVYDQPKKLVTLYINDKSVQAKEATLGPGLKGMLVGANPTYGENFVGDIEDIGLYGRCWTAEDVAKAYKEHK
jgi:hypothetical protein